MTTMSFKTFTFPHNPEKITVTESIPESLDAIKKSGHGRLYAVTCFSDKDKILSRVERG